MAKQQQQREDVFLLFPGYKQRNDVFLLQPLEKYAEKRTLWLQQVLENVRRVYELIKSNKIALYYFIPHFDPNRIKHEHVPFTNFLSLGLQEVPSQDLRRTSRIVQMEKYLPTDSDYVVKAMSALVKLLEGRPSQTPWKTQYGFRHIAPSQVGQALQLASPPHSPPAKRAKSAPALPSSPRSTRPSSSAVFHNNVYKDYLRYHPEQQLFYTAKLSSSRK